MMHRVCPWWLGYLLASPLRRMMEDPVKVVGSYVYEGMTVLEPGPGMGFFTLPLARLVGASGRVVAVDIQPRMLASLRRRARRAHLADRLVLRQASAEGLGIDDLAGKVDFTLAFAVVHELPAVESFFAQVAAASKPDAVLLFVEPSGHVTADTFEWEMRMAIQAGFALRTRPVVKRSHAALLIRV